MAALFAPSFPVAELDWALVDAGGAVRLLVLRYALTGGAERAWATLKAATASG